jgi:chemotaxis protein MotB
MRLAPWIVAAAVVSGCSWKKDIEGLEATVAARDSTLAERDATIAARDAALHDRDVTIARLEAELADLERQIEALRTDLATRTAQLDEERARSTRILSDRGSLRTELDSLRAALAELEARKRQAEQRVAAYRHLVSRFQKLIDAGKLDVKVVDGRMVVVLATDILFPSGSADLSEDGKVALAEVGAVLSTIENRYQVEGHTDNVPIRTTKFPSNWYLGAARAIGVVDHLLASGLQPDHVSAAAFADTKPVAPNTDDAGRARNRRIEIVVVPDLSGLPGYDELNALD